MAQVSFRMDDNLKAAAESTFKSMGMTLSTAVTVFVTQVVKLRRFPFSIEAEPSMPAETQTLSEN